jgi:hypothetical protein
MGLNNEYGEDAFFESPDDVYEDEQEDFTLEPEDWHDWNSEHVLNMWFSLRQYLEDNHLTTSFLNHARFHDFAEFVRVFSR